MAARWNLFVGRLRRLVGSASASEESDRGLLERFVQEGNQEAFAHLVRRHSALVYEVCRRQLADESDAEDAFQATFCVLARKAGALAWQESVSNWLYGVALRVAAKVRATAARRNVRERQAVLMRSARSETPLVEPEVRAALDEELARLPAKYRAPLVLCYLAGQTNEEAARQLGWPKGTVQGRLARAREVLRGRLLRRGVSLAVAEVLLDGAGPSGAAVPSPLVETTITVAARFAAESAAGAVPAPVVTLAEGVLHAMWLTKLKTGLALVLAVAAVGLGAGWFLLGRSKDQPQAVAAPLGPGDQSAGITSSVPCPDGVFDAAGKVAFLTNPKGQIVAMDLESGKPLWTSTDAGRALLAEGNRLFAQIGQIDSEIPPMGRTPLVGSCTIGVFDLSQQGKLLKKSEPLAVPLKDKEYGDLFQLSDARLQQDTLLLRWRSRHAPYFGGAAPPPDLTKRLARTAQGVAKVNVQTGRTEMITEQRHDPDDDFGRRGRGPGPDRPAPPARLPDALKKVYEQQWTWGPVVVGDRLAAVANAPTGDAASMQVAITLRTWDIKSGKAMEPITLARGDLKHLGNTLTLDRQHIYIDDQGKPLGLFALATGQRVADKIPPLNWGQAFVYGRRAYYVESGKEVAEARNPKAPPVFGQKVIIPRTLRAVDWTTGKTLWEFPLRADVPFRGPYPP